MFRRIAVIAVLATVVPATSASADTDYGPLKRVGIKASVQPEAALLLPAVQAAREAARR
jgi:hypothetical protein